MKILIVYDSFFGNTQKIAEAIAEGFHMKQNIIMAKAADFTGVDVSGYGLLISGSPTRGFRPSPDTMAFLKSIKPHSLEGMKVAAFDTRIELETIKTGVFRFMVDKGGYAAKGIIKELEKKGGIPVADPKGFFVTGTEGPLKENEAIRASEWARQIAIKLHLP